jgi:hypothetical protein
MKVLVFGQGKSGTTVLAKTIQHSLPDAAFVMEPKPDEALSRDRAPHAVSKLLHGQWTQEIPRLTSVLRNESQVRFDRIVKIIRDPRDQALSSFLYAIYGRAQNRSVSDAQLRAMVELVRRKEENPSGISFADLCGETNRIMRWNGYSSAWLFTESGHVANRNYWNFLRSLGEAGYLVRYETFMQNDLADLENYLGFKLSGRREVGEYERTRRTASWDNWREFFTTEDVETLRPLIGDLLFEMGYRDWELRPVGRLNREHFSGYLTRLIEEARTR